MTVHAAERPASRRLDLPPGFTLLSPGPEADAFAFACEAAERHGAGSLIWAPHERYVDFAVVLEPDDPLETPSRCFIVAMAAALDALGVVAPPDKPLTVDWPDTIRFDGARLGGGRLGWPAGGGEAPPWLVFSVTLIASKSWAGDPGLTPDSTSLEEEGFAPDEHPRLVEAFARYLMRGVELWREEGLEAASIGYVERLSGGPRGRIEDAELLAALRSPSWRDGETGRPRL